jgi:hypothetical protein
MHWLVTSSNLVRNLTLSGGISSPSAIAQEFWGCRKKGRGGGVLTYLTQNMLLGYVAAILCLQFVVHVMLFPMKNVSYFYISPLLGMCTAPTMFFFCNTLISGLYVVQVLSEWFWDGFSCPYYYLVSLLLSHSTYAVCVCCNILNRSRLRSWSHNRLLEPHYAPFQGSRLLSQWFCRQIIICGVRPAA